MFFNSKVIAIEKPGKDSKLELHLEAMCVLLLVLAMGEVI